MKKLRTVYIMLAISLTMPLFSGCFAINSQKMKRVKGTYQLTNYTYTPSYERREGYTPVTIDYIADRGYEVYLVVTGDGSGYYVHKDNETTAYSKEVSLSYQYDQEDTSKVSYVKYKDSTESNWNDFGVTRNALNYSRPAFDYTEIITKRKMRSESIDKDWKKVDEATDLSYVKSKLGELKEYSYEGWANRGLYELNSYTSADNTMVLLEESFPYLYYYVAFDTSSKMTATTYYALKTDNVPVVKTETITLSPDWTKILIGSEEWTAGDWGSSFYQVVGEITEADSFRREMNRIRFDYTLEELESLIASKQPVETPIE